MTHDHRPHRAQAIAAISSIFIVLGIGTALFHRLEDWTWAQSFYFTVVTTTTVGYGDLYPTTDESRLIASFFILFGVGVLVTAIGYAGSYFIKRSEARIIKRHEKNQKNN